MSNSMENLNVTREDENFETESKASGDGSMENEKAMPTLKVNVDQLMVRTGNSGDAEMLESPGKMFNIVCDDCARADPIRLWRWCQACERVLCETCSVDGHFAHEIQTYASAVRRWDDELRQVVEEVRTAAENLRVGANATDELKEAIVAKFGAIKREMRAKFNKNKNSDLTIAEQMGALMQLEREPLNAKTWIERGETIDGLDKLMKMAVGLEKDTEDYLKSVDLAVDESGRQMGKIFREDN